MATFEIEVEIADHLKTPEGIARFNKAVEARNQADYECFQVLRDLAEQGVLTARMLTLVLGDDVSEAQGLATEVERVLELRRQADLELTHAMRGTE